MKKISIPIRRPWIPYIIFVISLLLTCLSTIYVNRTVNSHEQLRFQNTIQQVESSIDNRLETYTALQRGGAALFSIDEEVTRDDFSAYVERLRFSDRYTGIQGFGFAQRVTKENKENFIERQRVNFNQDYNIRPDSNKNEYYVVRYLEPENEINNALLGFDLATETVQKEAMELARDGGSSVTSGRILMNQSNDTDTEPGFIIFTPVYQDGTIPNSIQERREKLIGFVYSIFLVKDFLTGVFGDPQLSSVQYEIYDGDGIASTNLLYKSTPDAQGPTLLAQPPISSKEELSIAGKNWTIIFTSIPSIETTQQRIFAPFIFIGGLLVCFTLFLLSRAEYLARSHAEESAIQLAHSERQLQKAVGLRDNFISIASHELKTPVTSLKIYADVLYRQCMATKQKQQADYLQKMNKQIDKLTMLIQDLLDVSRLQSGRLSFKYETFPINTMIDEVVDNVQQIADGHTILITKNSKKKITGDRDRIGQVLSNLLTNAIKYSPNSDKIEIATKELKNEIIISVTDYGIGIDKKHQDKVFSRFYRVTDDDENTYPGLGIGLFICNEIIKRHKGRITVQSSKGKGSTFSIRLPYKQTP